MNIPDDLKIISLIYEYRFFALVPFYTAWMLGGFYLFFRWKFPHYVWYLPLILCGIGSCAFAKSLEMGFFCIVSMLILPIADFFGIKKAIRKTCNPHLQTPAGDGMLPMRR